MEKKIIKTVDNLKIRLIICNSCGNVFQSIDPHYSDENYNYHLCTDCIERIAENHISSMGGIGFIWMEIIKNKYFKRHERKRNTYLPKELKVKILKKYKFTCQKCGTKENLTIDHIKPVAKGGTDRPENLTILCRSCNSRKGSRT